MPRSPRPARLRCEGLEARETPAALGTPLTDGFDAGGPFQPAGWQGWASNGQPYYMETRAAALSGGQALAAFGTVGVESRLWNRTPVSGNVAVSAAIRSDAPAPVLLLARGANLDGFREGYVGVAVSAGGGVQLREEAGGKAVPLGTRVPLPNTAGRFWLRVTLSAVGDTATVRVQRLDTNQYLAATGRWQTEAADAVTAKTTVPAADGFAGVGRLSGPYGTAYIDDFRADPVTAVPQKRAWIRLAQLAYAGTPVGATEQTQFRDAVDLTVTSPDLLDDLSAASAATPQLVYSNVSNLYGGLLTDWLSYADRTGADREAAFYHVAQPTAFSGSSPSSVPVNQFTDVQRVSALGTALDLTANARGGRSTGVSFGTAAGDSIVLGWPDRFREVNVDVSRAAANGWAGAWEYSTTDAAGRTVWKPLPLLADGTAGMTADGRLTFDPPRDWTPTRVGSGDRLFYLRLRTAAAGTAPEAATLFGRDYVGAAGRSQGTIPAFDSAADADHDGYLNDAEWANRRAGFDARFVHESRLFYPNYGQMRFVTNPSTAAFRGWAADFHVRQLAANPLAGGLFLDNANGKLPTGGASVTESTATYTADAAAAVAAVTRAVAPRVVIANTSGAAAEADGITKAATGAFEEFLLRPAGANWSAVGDAANTVTRRLAATGADGRTPLVILDSLPPDRAGMTDPRWLSATLSYYYLLADPQNTLLMFWGGYAPAAGWSAKSSPQVNFNVGRPKGAMTTFATGKDPADARLDYKVFARDYDNALVLFKPLSYTRGVATGTTADNTATTHQLNGRYRVLDANGVPSATVVTSITLRNGEGAILVKA